MFTLDTNILIYYAAGEKEVCKFLLEKMKNDIPLILPTIVVIEFLSFPSLKAKERTLFSRLLGKLRITSLDFEIAKKAAFLRQKYDIKVGDSVIAATTLLTKSKLLTRNIHHFRKIPNLPIVSL